MKTRRELLKKISIGAALSATGAYSAVQLTSFLNPKENPLTSDWLFNEECDEDSDQPWCVSQVSPIERGACVMTLTSKKGESARVHICAHEGQPKGVAFSGFLDFVLMDGGDGQKPTDEDLGCKLLSLARYVLIKELKMSDGELNRIDGALAQLQTHASRLELYRSEGLL